MLNKHLNKPLLGNIYQLKNMPFHIFFDKHDLVMIPDNLVL